MKNVSFEKINATALPLLRTLVREWVPGGAFKGKEYCAASIHGGKGRSFSVNVETGKWGDFSSNGTERGSDPISLYAAVFTNDDQKRAADELATSLAVTPDSQPPEPVKPKTDAWEQIEPDASTPEANLSRWDQAWPYHNRDGRVTHYVVRRGSGKDKFYTALTWGRKDGVLGWHMKQPKAPRPLYRLHAIAKAKQIIVCEGEKAADAAQTMFPRIICISWMAGTNNVTNTDWSPLAGKNVLIWPDNDEPGQKAADEIVSILSGLAASVRKLDVSDLPDKADAADVSPDQPVKWLKARTGEILAGTDLQERQPAPPPAVEGRRTANLEPIQVVTGSIDLAATQGEQALIAAKQPVFARGNNLVRPGRREVSAADGKTTVAACLVPLNPSSMIDVLCQTVEWKKWNKKAGELVSIDPPPAVANIMLSRVGRWNYSALAGLITAPTLRPDGSALIAPGYDEATKLYHVPDETLKVELPKPSYQAAEQALELVDGLLDGFPFKSPVDRSVALAAILTTVARGAMPVAPLFAFRATTPGSGKSFLVDVVSVIATGRPCPVTSAAKDDDKETEKRLAGLIMSGTQIMSLDNVNGELGGDLLCQAVERPILSIRPLGTTELVEIENRSVMFATGNGLRVKGDMTRRTVICNLDAGVEQPELRQFAFNPIEAVMKDRGKYVAACLTVVQSYMLKGDPQTSPNLASFEVWSRTVRAALTWLGHEDPCDSMDEARADDPEMDEMRSLIGSLGDAMGIGRQFAKPLSEIERLANSHVTDPASGMTLKFPELHDALGRIAGSPSGKINTRSLGRWFMNKKGRIVDGKRIVDCGLNRNKVRIWAVEAVQ
ncbi:topoisomerase [Gluconobacter thailandicus]|uniref:topoisomerase n=1 Tax=Gluconobacter thailandicus TaxID=257438 RepID=UPI0007780E9D|nr:topoisomerase [Gluconobacter thailandicus]KXV35721.1 topoisomerase [Gluconobacter thailandicus]